MKRSSCTCGQNSRRGRHGVLAATPAEVGPRQGEQMLVPRFQRPQQRLYRAGHADSDATSIFVSHLFNVLLGQPRDKARRCTGIGGVHQNSCARPAKPQFMPPRPGSLTPLEEVGPQRRTWLEDMEQPHFLTVHLFTDGRCKQSWWWPQWARAGWGAAE